MQEYLFVSWNLHGKGGVKAAQAVLQRCDLRHEAHQELDVPMDDPDTDEPWSTGSFGWVKLPKEDPRLARLLEELRAIGEKPLTRLCRVYSRKERTSAPWLVVTGSSCMVTWGTLAGQKWSFEAACRECGAGAVPIPPLIARLDRMPKSGWVFTSQGGFVIVSSALARSLQRARLTGFELLTVRTPSRTEPDRRFHWLRVTSNWPAPIRTPTCRTAHPCGGCRQPALLFGEPAEIHYDRVPAGACDFNVWQGTLLPDDRGASPHRPTGGSRELFLSQRAYATLKAVGVKALRCEPIYFRDL